jgi:hypothetical protein
MATSVAIRMTPETARRWSPAGRSERAGLVCMLATSGTGTHGRDQALRATTHSFAAYDLSAS